MVFFEDVEEGTEITPLDKGPITREEIHAYGKASGDRNPIHMDEEFAKKVGLPSVIQHGLRTMAFVCQTLTDWLKEGGELKRINCKFVGMVLPDDVITSRGKVVKKYEEGGEKLIDVEVEAVNQKGENAIVGDATIVLPSSA